MVKKYLNVSYADRDLAKRLGARWDPAVKRWYAPKGSAILKILAWRQESRAVSHAANASSLVPQPPLGSNFELPLAS